MCLCLNHPSFMLDRQQRTSVTLSLAILAAPGGGGSSIPMLLPLLLIPVLYLVMIRPQQKKQKQWQEMLGKPFDY